jgi:hypothetical protein
MRVKVKVKFMSSVVTRRTSLLLDFNVVARVDLD